MIIEVPIRGGYTVELSTAAKPSRPGAEEVSPGSWLDACSRELDDSRPSSKAMKDFLREIVFRRDKEISIAELIQLAARCHLEFGRAASELHRLSQGRFGWYLQVVKLSPAPTDDSTTVKFIPIPVCESEDEQEKQAVSAIVTAMRGVGHNQQLMANNIAAALRSVGRSMWIPVQESVTEWKRLCNIINARQKGRLMMAIGGDPSIGKTYLAEHYALNGRESYNVTLTEDTFASELKGHAVIVDGGALKWFDGPALRAYRNGGRIVINEIQRAATNTLSFLLELTDSPGSSKISLPPPSGETITPHPDFQVIATYNGLFEDMPEALRSRFSINVYMHTANPDAIRSLPESLHQIAAKTVTVADVTRRISLRHWQEFAALRNELQDEETAAWAIFGSQASDILAQIKLRNA